MNEYTYNDYRQLGFTTITNALLQNYAKLGLNENQLVIVLQLESLAQQQNFLPTNESLAARTNFNVAEIGQILQSLIEQDLLEIIQLTDENLRIQDHYSLNPLYKQLNKFLNEHLSKNNSIKENNQLTDKQKVDPIQTQIRQFEIEFGRMLSPMEREMISNWFVIDHYEPDVIQLALREAVLAQVYNFKYIDRILLNWSRMNLKTANQVTRYLQQ